MRRAVPTITRSALHRLGHPSRRCNHLAEQNERTLPPANFAVLKSAFPLSRRTCRRNGLCIRSEGPEESGIFCLPR